MRIGSIHWPGVDAKRKFQGVSVSAILRRGGGGGGAAPSC